MTDIEKDMAKAAASTAVQLFLGPIATVVSDAINGTVGDRLAVWRQSKPAWKARNAHETAERALQILRERGVEDISSDTRPEQAEEILQAASETGAKEIQELFARLLAAAADPSRLDKYRSDFLNTVKAFEPIDALVLKEVAKSSANPGNWREAAVEALKRESDEIVLSAHNLERLGCIEKHPNASRVESSALMTARGRLLLSLLE